MKQFFLSALLLLFFFLSKAQDTTAIHYSLLIKPDDVKAYLQVLASDSLEGRETGKLGQRKAAAFIAQHFKSLGLLPIADGKYLQDIYLSTRANTGKNIEVNDRFFLYMKDYFYVPGFADTLLVVDTILFAGYGISDSKYDDYKDNNVSGKAIMFFDGEPQNRRGFFHITETKQLSEWSGNLNRKIKLAAGRKAPVVFIVSDSIEKISYNFNRSKTSVKEFFGKEETRLPFVFITREMARTFYPELKEEELDKAKSRIDRKGEPQSFVSSVSANVKMVSNTDEMKGQNVVSFLEGTDKKNEVVVVTAHYDHLGKKDSLIYYGADDNGSGTSAVMELAKAFSIAKREGHGPRRSMLFMTVSGEEKGLLGSSYYVEHPLIPLANTVVDLNIDMIGRTDEKHDSTGVRNYVYIIGSDKLSTTLHQINEKANATYTKFDFDYTFNRPDDPNRFYFRSDHYNFAKHKVPIIFYFNGTHKDYHKPTDTIDKIDFYLLAKRAQLVFFTAWDLANREDRIKVDVKNDFETK